MQTAALRQTTPNQHHTKTPTVTESQIMQSLNSSIEDLLAKISKVTNDYNTQPQLSTPTPTLRFQDLRLRKPYSLNEGQPHTNTSLSFSTESNIPVKQNLNNLQEVGCPLKGAFSKFRQESNQIHSLKVIGDNLSPKLHRINSLFDGSGIKEVAESRIMSQVGEGSCNRLQNRIISDLKGSIVGLGGSQSSLSLCDFQLGKEVGSGKFGDVYVCRHKATGGIFAIKKIFKSVIQQYKMQSQFALQLKIMYYLQHPNIVKLYGHFCDEYHIFLLLEYMEGGELISKLGSSEEYVSRTIGQMLDAVEYMHCRGVIHRDIKPENIVLAFQNTVKLCDFGWAGLCGNNTMKTTFCGTLDYVSPEMKDKGEYTATVDIWSLGVLTFELLTKNAPFAFEIAKWKRRGSQRSQLWDWNILYPPQVSPLAQSFMRNLLKQNPDDRASLRYCRNHFFIRRYRDEEGGVDVWCLS